MGVLYHADDLGQCGIRAYVRRAISKPARPVHCAACHRIVRAFVHRDRLARDHALIHVAGAVHDHAIYGDPFAGTHNKRVADLHLFKRNIQDHAVALYPRRAHLQTHQTLDRGPRPPLCARLQKAAKKDQRHDHGGGLEIDRARDLGQYARREGGHDGEPIGCKCADRDEAVHIRRAAEQRGQALGIKPPSRPKQHGGGQHPLDQPRGLMPDAGPNRVMQRGDQVAAHFQNENRQSKRQRPPHPPPGRLRLRRTAGRQIGGGVCVLQHAGIARLCCGLGQGLRRRHPLKNLHGRAFRGQIDGGRDDSWHFGQCAFGASDAPRAGHAPDL